jgi:hypothetical protein
MNDTHEAQPLDVGDLVERERGRIIDAMGLLSVLEAALATREGANRNSEPQYQTLAEHVHEVLNDIAGKLDPLYVRQAIVATETGNYVD